ncbi:MAG: ATP synthase F1 subunit delta [Treponema sp.]|jgi:F-type H+-transporting ATPase subunit delta|nr:ATP synthase F1 subunit delta [Treponema sp.]
MFTAKSWAEAFINSIEKEGGDIEDSFNTLKALASWISLLPGTVFGREAAEKLEPLIRKGISAAQETVIRFFLLTVKKNKIRHIDLIIREIKKALDIKRGVIEVSAEYAFQPGKEFESLVQETIKKRTGASRVELTAKINQELIGGYRLRIGDEIIDASVRCQLESLKVCLAAGPVAI